VDVVAHQAVGPDEDSSALRSRREQGQIQGSVGIREEDLLAPAPTLDHVMGHSWHDNSGESRHPRINLLLAASLGRTPGDELAS
jgi:hypothetical protein